MPAVQPRGTVLLVDDTGANGELLKALLEPSGYEVLVARTMTEGEKLALERRPRLIVSDVHIGEEDGFDFIARVRAHAALAAIPFVFLSSTAWNVAHDQRRARQAGAADFIQRPIEGPAFIKRIEAAMQEKRGQDPFPARTLFPQKGPDPFS